MLINGSPYNDNDTVNGDGKFHPKLIGTLENDIINAFAGSDYLDGGGGADQMYGGTGGDIYIVNHVNDKVFENANEGSDGVRSFVTYTMPNNVESLYLQGNANINGFGNNQDNTSLIGNSGSNYLRGGNGSNILNGLGGADTLEGMGTTNDFYVVDNAEDKIVDRQGSGIETVSSTTHWDLRISYKRVNPSDPNDLRVVLNDPGVEGLDNLNLLGAADLNAIGNKLANTIKGNNGSNTIMGREGHDTINGFSGNDTLYGNDGNDTLDGSYGSDNLKGSSGSDTLTGYGGTLTLFHPSREK